MKRRALAVVGLVAMLLTLLPGALFAAAPPAAPLAEPAPKTYLPLLARLRQPGLPPSPYAAALSQALASCAGTALNQVCYARGSVTLVGGGPLTAPGQTATLAGVSGLTLVSPDANHWSVALLRLAADSPTPGLGLILLAFGNVEIRDLTLLGAGHGELAPAFSFSSGPVPGQDAETGGLIVYNPAHEEPLAIRLNGADLTLASSAVVQARPGAMAVTMATGSALVKTAAGDAALVQAHQLTVPLDGNGQAAGAPTSPALMDDDLLEPLVPREEDDLLAPLVPPKVNLQAVYERVQDDFNSAWDRCLGGDSRQVYRVMYHARLMKQFERVYPDGLMALIDQAVQQCARFELEFNSVITETSMIAWGNMYVQGQGMIVKYHMDGRLVQQAQMPLTHLRYDIDYAFGSGCYYVRLADGGLHLFDGTMRINRNRLDISTSMLPAGVMEHLIVTCGDLGEIANPALWGTLFRGLHESEQTSTQIPGGFVFTPAHWKYTGNHILAEAIFTGRKVIFGDEVTTGDTWLVLLHRPSR